MPVKNVSPILCFHFSVTIYARFRYFFYWSVIWHVIVWAEKFIHIALKLVSCRNGLKLKLPLIVFELTKTYIVRMWKSAQNQTQERWNTHMGKQTNKRTNERQKKKHSLRKGVCQKRQSRRIWKGNCFRYCILPSSCVSARFSCLMSLFLTHNLRWYDFLTTVSKSTLSARPNYLLQLNILSIHTIFSFQTPLFTYSTIYWLP